MYVWVLGYVDMWGCMCVCADMFLDCFTYNAHTTPVDSLWACVCGCVDTWRLVCVYVCVCRYNFQLLSSPVAHTPAVDS